MKSQKSIRALLSRQPTMEGAGVHLHRVFGHAQVPMFDPFLMLDDFRSDIPEHYRKGFPWHPHRGIETVTYVLKGEVAHGDSMGNEGVIRSGDAQWMTAGSGIVHQEMPRGEADGAMHGFQLWTNLPATRKMMPPRYRGITADRIPEVIKENGARVRIIAGSVDGVRGPMDDIVIDPEFLDCTVPAGETFIHASPPDHTTFIYVIAGTGQTDGQNIENGILVLYGEGDVLAVSANGEALRFLLLTGKPLGEPVAWRGPIVMNTQQELDAAFEEYRLGTFVRPPKKERRT